MNCWAPNCPFEPRVWPTVLIGRLDGGAPYRLEVPKPVCAIHMGSFTADHFLSPPARDRMRRMAGTWGTGELNFDQVAVEWQALDHPSFVELDGREARFCAPALV